jgi:hypothetical protein
MTRPIDVAVIGAGPYGLSISAYLTAEGIGHRIFGQPMQTWSSRFWRAQFAAPVVVRQLVRGAQRTAGVTPSFATAP